MADNVEEVDFVQYSEPVEEIITDIPHWLVRSGMTIFLVVISVFIVLAYFIRIPDVVHGAIVFEKEVPPEEIVVNKSGKLVSVFVKENTLVDSGDILGYVESTANHVDILHLNEQLTQIYRTISGGDYNGIAYLELKNQRHLGELQANYQEFAQKFVEFKGFLSNGVYERKIKSLKSELDFIHMENTQLKEQLLLEQNNYALSEKTFDAYEKLFEKKIISPQELRTEESKLINSKLPIQNAQSAIIANISKLEQKKNELNDITNTVAETKLNFLSVVNRFRSEVDGWIRDYVLRANTKGKIVLTKMIKVGQWIEANKTVMFVEREHNSPYIARLQIGQHSLGKVAEGQRVMIKLDAYPYQEYGVLYGKIDYLSDISSADSGYIATVRLEEGNKSSYNKALILKNGLTAEGEIITRDRNLLSKLFENVYSLLLNNG